MENKMLLKMIISYIEQKLNDDLTLDKMAKELNYSKFYIERIFSENMDCTVHQYIQRRRLTRAAQELVETKKPIIEIAYDACYNSQQAFTLAFKKLYLCTPQIYRKNGVFQPKQTRITLNYNGYSMSVFQYMRGRSIAA